MREWVSKQLGSDEWERLVIARRLKKKQLGKVNDYDPDVVPQVFVGVDEVSMIQKAIDQNQDISIFDEHYVEDP